MDVPQETRIQEDVYVVALFVGTRRRDRSVRVEMKVGELLPARIVKDDECDAVVTRRPFESVLESVSRNG